MYKTQKYQYFYTMGTYDGTIVDPEDRAFVQQVYDELSTEDKEVYEAPMILSAVCDPIPPKSSHDIVAEQYAEEMGHTKPPI